MLKPGRIRATVLPVLLGTVLALGCTSEPVAVVNGKPVDADYFRRHLREKMLEKKERRNGRMRTVVLNEVIIESLILEEARQFGITASEDEARRAVEHRRKAMGEEAFGRFLRERGMKVEEFLQEMRDRIVMERFRTALEMQHPVTEAELRDHYRNSPRPFIRTPQSLVKMIGMRSEEEARQVVREMRQKKIDFDVMAARLASEGKASVMDYAWVRPGYFSEPVARAIMNLGAGRFGGPYEGKEGYYLIRVKDREKETIAPFEEVKEEIRNTLREERRQKVFAMWLDQKKRWSSIEIHLD